MDELVCAADELEVVVTDELGGDAGTKQPAGPARGDRPVLHLTRGLSQENTQLLQTICLECFLSITSETYEHQNKIKTKSKNILLQINL